MNRGRHIGETRTAAIVVLVVGITCEVGLQACGGSAIGGGKPTASEEKQDAGSRRIGDGGHDGGLHDAAVIDCAEPPACVWHPSGGTCAERREPEPFVIPEAFDQRRFTESSSIAIDADGFVHAAYGEVFEEHCDGDCPEWSSVAGRLLYGTNRTGTWKTVSFPRFSSYRTKIAIDGDGFAHVAGSGGGQVRYATNRSGTWRVAEFGDGTAADVGLAVAADGSVRLAAGGAWPPAEVEMANGDDDCALRSVGRFACDAYASARAPTLVDAPDGASYVAFLDDRRGTAHMHFGAFAGGKWRFEEVACWGASNNNAVAWGWPRLAVDAAGHAYICHGDAEGRVMVANNARGGWEEEQVGTGFNCAVAVDAEDRLHVAWISGAGLPEMDDHRFWMHHRMRDGEMWHERENVTALGPFQSYATEFDIAIGPDGRVRIGWSQDEGLYLATREDDGWSRALLTEPGADDLDGGVP